MKKLQGTITAMKTPSTAQVVVTRQWQHPVYGKSVKRTKRYACHFSEMELQNGDEVIIEPCRPMSKTKRFRIVQKVKKLI